MVASIMLSMKKERSIVAIQSWIYSLIILFTWEFYSDFSKVISEYPHTTYLNFEAPCFLSFVVAVVIQVGG